MVLFLLSSQLRRKIMAVDKPQEFDQFLKPIALLALFYAILLGYGLIGFQFMDTLIR